MFKNNKYSNWYYSIINKSKNRINNGYIERHHIIPRSLGGSDNHENIALLTAKEHFICHLLLTKMCISQKDEWKMICAYLYFRAHDKNLKSKQYKSLKEKFIKNHPLKGKNKSIETKEKMKNSWTNERRKNRSNEYKGKNNPFYGKSHSDEFKINMSLNNPAKKEEVKEKMRGPRPDFVPNTSKYGISNETKLKISKSLLGHKDTEKTKMKKRKSKENLVWVHKNLPKSCVQIKNHLLLEYLSKDYIMGRGPKKFW